MQEVGNDFPREGEREKIMSKILVGLFLGVFVGALAYELLNRAKPELVRKIEAKAFEKVDNLLKPAEAALHQNETA